MREACPACASEDLVWWVGRERAEGGFLEGECMECGCQLDRRPFGPEGPPPGYVAPSPGCSAGQPKPARG